jgi:hypothetical protein
MKKLYLALTFLLIFTSSAQAVDVFVDNSASCTGDNGSTTNPWCTIQDALSNAVAGHTIKIRTGTGVYSEQTFVSGRSGTLGNPIIVEPDSGASFVLRNTGNGNTNASIMVKESDYWTFRNLVFNASGVTPSLYALKVQCETKSCVGIEIRNNQFLNWRQDAAKVDWGPNVLSVGGCDSDSGFMGACGGSNKTIAAIIDGNTFTANETNNIHVFSTINSTISNNTITDLRCGAHSSAVNAVGIYYEFDNRDMVMEDNIISDFNQTCARAPLSSSALLVAGIYCDVWSRGITIRRNTLFNLSHTQPVTNNAQSSQGMYIEAECQDTLVENNIVYNIDNGTGLRMSYHTLDPAQLVNRFYNNTVYDVAVGFGIADGTAELKNNIIKNVSVSAVCLPCFTGSFATIDLTADYNIYDVTSTRIGSTGSGGGFMDMAAWRSYCSCGDTNSFSSDPLFTNAAGADFTLTSGSPAKNAGVTLASVTSDFLQVGRPQGVAYDIGAYEFIEGGSGSGGSSILGVFDFTGRVTVQ